MKLKTKRKIKEGIESLLKTISSDATRRLRPFRAVGTMILILFFNIIFIFAWLGITEDLFNGIFEVTVILFLMLISISLLFALINLNNGFLGIANMILLFTGILGGISRNPDIIILGITIIKIFWGITVVSMFYEIFFRRKDDRS